jgi:uncharacterized membrane protein
VLFIATQNPGSCAMTILILGLIVVLGTHSLKVFAPAWRLALVNRLGDGPYKAVNSLVSLIGLILIVWGFGLAWQDPAFVYAPPSWGRHVAMALMVPALILAFASGFPASWIKRYVAHPLLAATMLWAVAHLFANGDLAGVVLFAAILIWAVVDRLFQSAAPAPAAVPTAPGKGDYAAIAAGLALYAALVGGLHFWLFGVSPVG